MSLCWFWSPSDTCAQCSILRNGSIRTIILALFDPRTLRVVFTILCVAAVLAFIYAARRMLMLFLFAIFFAYLIDPLVNYVQRRLKTRGRAIAAVYLAGVAALVLVGYLLGPRLVSEGQHLAQSAPGMYQKLVSGEVAWTIGSQHGWSYESTRKAQEFVAGHSQVIVAFLQSLGTRIAKAGKDLWWVALIPILGVFFLKDGRAMVDSAIELAGRRRDRAFLNAVVTDVNVMLAQFIRAQLILAALSGAVYTIVLLILRVPFAVALGIVGGVLEFIPVVGPLVAAIGICGVALASGYAHIVILVVFLGAWRLLQDYVNSPRIMGGQIELHPLAVLFGVLVGAEIAGVVGVYLSIPLMATLRIVFRQWHAYMERPQVIAPPTVASDRAA